MNQSIHFSPVTKMADKSAQDETPYMVVYMALDAMPHWLA